MDPRLNPYAPGAGTQPPQLTGREEILEKVSIAIDRCRTGLSARGVLMVGLRGVGKTVLLTRMSQEAEAKGLAVVSVEAPEKRSLPALLIPALRSALLKVDRVAATGALFHKALHALSGFMGAMKIKYADVELAIDMEKQHGIADSGDLEHDLMELLTTIGEALKERKTALILFIDEIQYLEEDHFAALIMALHKCSQKQLPVLLIGAGLPQLVGQAGRAKSYAERLFEYPEIGPLTELAAKQALEAPAERLQVKYTPQALTAILHQTQSYPYFLQEWGKHCWDAALKSPISLDDVKFATQIAISELDASFFRVRFDRLTPAEKKYLRGMAELDPQSCRSGDIANILQREVQSVAPIRASLMGKGMIYSPSHGDNAFTVPLFSDYLKRVIPNFQEE